MTAEKTYTLDDVFKNERGLSYIKFKIPSTGECLQIQGHHPEMLVDQANDFVREDIITQKSKVPYANGVKALAKVCLTQGGSGARAAAQVLLGTYNRFFHLDLTDLCNLDKENFNHAMAVIKGRVVCMREPQNMIDNGQEIFDQICDQWEHLHNKIRHKELYEC